MSSVKEVVRDHSSLKYSPFSMISDPVKIIIFRCLSEEDAKSAAAVCREWRVLNFYPNGSYIPRINSVFRCFFPRKTDTTFLDYERISRESKEGLLIGSSYLSRCGCVQPFSISEAYLRTDSIESRVTHSREKVSQEVGADPILRGFLEGIFDAEKTHQFSYCSFYHSLSTLVYLFGYSTQRLLSCMNASGGMNRELQEKYNPLFWFRFPQKEDSDFPNTVAEFFQRVTMDKAACDGGDFDDHNPLIKQWLLSVSPFLFANCMTSGEGSWQMFLDDRSMYPPNTETFFNALCDHFSLLPNLSIRARFLEEYNGLLSRGNDEAQSWIIRQRSQEQRDIDPGQRGNRIIGTLFQIMVPYSIVDDVAYPCREYGIPKDYSGRRMTKVFQEIQRNPQGHYTVQARMITRALIHPDNKIKINCYGTQKFFETKEGKAFERDFECFFMRVLSETTRES